MNPAAGVLAPAPGRLRAARLRRPGTADRIRFFLTRWLALHRPVLDLALPLAVLSIVSAAATLGSPLLRGNPLLLMALSPRVPFLMLAARRTRLVTFVAVGTVRLCLADPFHFRIGRQLGALHAPRWAGHRLARPASAAAVFLRPTGRHLALAGAVRMRPAVVAALDVTGTVLFLLGLRGVTALFH